MWGGRKMGGEYRSDYENSQIKAIVEWKNREPSVVSQGLGILAAPLAWVVKKSYPGVGYEGCIKWC